MAMAKGEDEEETENRQGRRASYALRHGSTRSDRRCQTLYDPKKL
jgi:hypothetical protein